MDAQALESEATSAIATASDVAELDQARVRYLGRKSELKQALRGVRDRESGMTLNGDVVLRTETSASQIRVMESRPPPVYMVSPGRVYRRDTPDATHVPIFHQIEGLAIDRGVTLGDLKGTLLHVARALFGQEREARFSTDFFPFTEPSLGLAISCFLCDGAGCAT